MTEAADERAVPDGRSARWNEHRAARRAEFLDATLRAVREHGAAVSMDEIAREAGVSKPRIYRYFADKHELFGAVAERTMATLVARLEPALTAARPNRAAVAVAVRAYVDLLDEDPDVAKFLFAREFADDTRGPVLTNGRRIGSMLAEVFAGYLRSVGAKTDGVDVWAQATVAAVGMVTAQWLSTRSISKRKLVDHLTTYLWGAVCGVLESENISVAEPIV